MNEIKHKILLVDDIPENLYTLECILMSDEREIIKVTSGQDALKIALQEDLSLIMLDVQMPEMDGFEVARILKSTNRTKKTPILFVTAISKEKKYMIQGLEEGAIDYLFKPLDMDITKAKVNTLLQFNDQQKELQMMNLELAQLNEQKNYFMGVASHDLRNPLCNILTLASFIEEETKDQLEDQHLDYLRIIISSSEQLLDMLNNLLDITKIETGKTALQLEETNICELIQNIVSEYHITASKKKITLEFSYNDKLPKINIDTDQMNHVIGNLVSNAIKYSNENTNIEIIAELKDQYIQISVIDQGQGIPEDEIKLLFGRFSKTSVKSTGGERSVGLGLNITKKVIESHGGQIWVKSKVGEGSTFAFTLPLVLQNTEASQ
jgi:signal transduction histidine kinase